MVPGYHLPLLWAHQLGCGIAARQLHSLHHPIARSHVHLPIRHSPRERSGAAAEVRRRVDRRLRDEHVRGRMGAGGGVRVGRLGQHDQLHPPDQHLRPLRQVLSVSTTPTPNPTFSSHALQYPGTIS
ncbi:hypothetical protein B296_00055822 [Ensete ventricosum]|uniref:Uncharacterized protein n=1 Tax=Ensete ventricosum TaxID=4639 RepID=A0A426X1N3_ENSVE|nr:hypothetical protein B296_00055822 [Ensete ventricosum]